MNRIPLICATLLMIATGAARATSCETNFSYDGDATQGMRFSTWRTIPGLDPARTIAELSAIAKTQGLEPYGDVTTEGPETFQDLATRSTGASRIFIVRVSANRTDDSLTILSILPEGMSAQPEDMRKDMCSLLAAAKGPAKPAVTTEQARTAPPSSSKPVIDLKFQTIFNLQQAQSALGPGDATITGQACSSNSGVLFLARNQNILLLPVTPYLQEWLKLRDKVKPGRSQLELSPAFLATNMVAMTNHEGEFMFRNMKPGQYYLLTTMDSSVSGSREVYMGSARTDAHTITDYYETQDYTNSMSKLADKIVSVKAGETVKLTLTPRMGLGVLLGNNNGSAGIFGCRRIGRQVAP